MNDPIIQPVSGWFRRGASPGWLRRAGGFTFLEVMIAVAILAITLPILLGLRNRDIDLHARARAMTTATLLAKEKLLEAELAPALQIGETGGEFTTPPPGILMPADVQNRAPRFRWKRIVAPTHLNAVREVRIQVLWPRGTANDMLEVSTYVFQSL